MRKKITVTYIATDSRLFTSADECRIYETGPMLEEHIKQRITSYNAKTVAQYIYKYLTFINDTLQEKEQ